MINLKKNLSGFTLIELLIVVAIIAILAAIAVPNFLEAQTRAKISRVKADMRSLVTAMESYRVDNNNYPGSTSKGATPSYVNDSGEVDGGFFAVLSTPVAYFTNPFVADPFKPAGDSYLWSNEPETGGFLHYYGFNSRGFIGLETSGADRGKPGNYWAKNHGTKVLWWALYSFGPDRMEARTMGNSNYINFANTVIRKSQAEKTLAHYPYDPTNGTKSAGDIYRFGGSMTGESDDMQYSTNLLKQFPQ